MNSAQLPGLVTSARRRLSIFVKLASICVLIGLLHIPLSMTRGVLKERRSYQTDATEAIAGGWGGPQLIIGPILAVPYAYKANVIRSKVVAGKVVQVEEMELTEVTAYFLPDTLTVNATAVPEVRHRGIYETVVYVAQAKLAGEFAPDFVAAGIDADRIDWDKARVYFGVSDLRGLRSVGALKTDQNTSAAFESADGIPDAFLPLVAKVSGVAAGAKLTFTMDVAVQGSRRLDIAPVGKMTSATLESAWSDPSFVGYSLPVTRRVGAGSFRAEWQSSHFSRGFPQSWTSRLVVPGEVTKKIEAASFGVRFAQPVDSYSMVERAQKYGVLFFVLIFTVFFLFEITAALRIHPLQYALVGVALCLFFIGFLALSEFWPTGGAYAAAAGACTSMVSLYAWSFLKTGWRTLVIGGGLGATYGYLYFVLRSQDYALIAGTVALFAALGLVMFCTRRVNWYGVETIAETSQLEKSQPSR